MVLVFGGEQDPGTGAVDFVSELMILSTDIWVWYPPAVSGKVPIARSGHSLTPVNNKVVVLFGGTRGRKWLDDVHALDLGAFADAAAWSFPPPYVCVLVHLPPPCPLLRHVSLAAHDAVGQGAVSPFVRRRRGAR